MGINFFDGKKLKNEEKKKANLETWPCKKKVKKNVKLILLKQNEANVGKDNKKL